MKKLKIDSICVKEDKVTNNSDPHVLAIHASSAFSYKSIEDSIDVFTGKSDGYVYTRYGNPTITAVEEKLANHDPDGIGRCPCKVSFPERRGRRPPHQDHRPADPPGETQGVSAR